LPIAGAEPAFEIHGPNLVAAARYGQLRPGQGRPSARASRPPMCQAPRFQPVRYGSLRGNFLPGIPSPECRRQFAPAPTAMAPPQLPSSLGPKSVQLMRQPVRSVLPFAQSTNAFLLEAFLPFVARSAAEPEQPTQSRHVLLGLRSRLHKTQPSRQRGDLFPRHGRGN
jgi:hypothetical protein